MTDLLCASDFTPEPGLFPISQEHSPFQVGEKVAFREDHSLHGAVAFEGDWEGEEPPPPARYGVIRAIGVSGEGLVLDLLVLDQVTGLPIDAVTGRPYEVEGNPTIHRAAIEEIQ